VHIYFRNKLSWQSGLADHASKHIRGDLVANSMVGDRHHVHLPGDNAPEPAMTSGLAHLDKSILFKKGDKLAEGALMRGT
jgi:hypothetical protein